MRTLPPLVRCSSGGSPMHRFRSAARFLADHWVLVLAVLVNLAIAAPVGAVRYNNDVCGTADGQGFEECCTTCWFFCDCDVEIDDGGDGGET